MLIACPWPLRVPQIALRGLALLNVGGIMCYSTCSLNPIENEAVVAELLRRAGGAIELIEGAAAKATQLAGGCAPGMTHWQVYDFGLHAHASLASLRADGSVTAGQRRLYRASMWPPATPGWQSWAPLERCVRLLPHCSDSGGFFVALLRKVRPLPKRPTPEWPRRGGRAVVGAVAARHGALGSDGGASDDDDGDDSDGGEDAWAEGGYPDSRDSRPRDSRDSRPPPTAHAPSAPSLSASVSPPQRWRPAPGRAVAEGSGQYAPLSADMAPKVHSFLRALSTTTPERRPEQLAPGSLYAPTTTSERRPEQLAPGSLYARTAAAAAVVSLSEGARRVVASSSCMQGVVASSSCMPGSGPASGAVAGARDDAQGPQGRSVLHVVHAGATVLTQRRRRRDKGSTAMHLTAEGRQLLGLPPEPRRAGRAAAGGRGWGGGADD
jgi:hypothetical protein